MSRKIRLIARLDVKDDFLVKGIQYEGLRKLGDPHDFARRYYEQGVDEILYLDTVASLYERNNLGNILERTTADVFIPITAGGGLRSVEDVGAVLKAGADKAAVNTAALRRPALITEIARAFGSQCMVLSIQAKRRDPARPAAGWEAYYDNGREHSGKDVLEWAREAVSLGAGEILLSSVDKEGFQKGMDQERSPRWRTWWMCRSSPPGARPAPKTWLPPQRAARTRWRWAASCTTARPTCPR